MSDSGKACYRWARPGRRLRDLNILLLLGLTAVSSALLLIPSSDDVLLGLPEVQLGDVSPRTIQSPVAMEIPDPRNTKRFRDAAAAEQLPVYDHQSGLLAETLDRIDAAFDMLRPEDTDPGRLFAFIDASGVEMSLVELTPLLSEVRPDEAKDAAASLLTRLMEAPIRLAKSPVPDSPVKLRRIDASGQVASERLVTAPRNIKSLDERRAEVDGLIASGFSHWSPASRESLALFTKALLRETVQPNLFETHRRRQSARDSVRTVVVPIAAGETVIRAGELIDEQKLLILDGMQAELQARSRLQITLGSALFAVLLVFFAYRIAAYGFVRQAPRIRDLSFMVSSYLIFMLGSWAGVQGLKLLHTAFPSLDHGRMLMLLPIAGVVLLMRVVVGMAPAAALTTAAVLTSGWMMDGSLSYAAYTAAGSLAAASVTRLNQPKSLIWTAFVRIAIAQAAISVALALLDSRFSFSGTGLDLAGALISAALSILVMLVLVPVVEALFGYTTLFRLADLANLNHPLLRKLLIEAPGSYHHSIMVGSMAEQAARVVGANPLLARVGGYYHDIGKLENPQIFAENEPAVFPMADPEACADAIRRHVSDGAAIAQQYRLGHEVREIILQHHGNSPMLKLYERARQRYGASADPERYNYQGRRPVSKEAGLVMLADAIEAVTRNQALLLPSLIDAEVDRVIAETTANGQLSACALSMADLGEAAAVFKHLVRERAERRGPVSDLPQMPSFPGLLPESRRELN